MLRRLIPHKRTFGPLDDRLKIAAYAIPALVAFSITFHPFRAPSCSHDPAYGWLVPFSKRAWQDGIFYALRHNSREVLRLSPRRIGRSVISNRRRFRSSRAGMTVAIRDQTPITLVPSRGRCGR